MERHNSLEHHTGSRQFVSCKKSTANSPVNHFTRPFGLVADGVKVRWSGAGFDL